MGFSVFSKFKATDGITPVFNAMVQAGNKFKSKTNSNFNSAGKSIKNMESQMKSLKRWFAGGLAGYLSIETFKTIGLGIIKTTAQFELFRISLETLLKSKSKGERFFESLKVFSTQTPFQMTDLVPAARQLLAFGVASESVIGKMRRLSDLSMGDSQKFSQLVYAYGKTKTIGIASMRELREFTTAGVPIFTILAKFKHVTTEGLLRLVRAKKITFADVDKVITQLTSKGGQFYNMTYKQAHTLGGLWTTTLDVLKNIGDTLGTHNNHLKNMKGYLSYFISHQKEMSSGLLKISDAADRFLGGIFKIFNFFRKNWVFIAPIIIGVTSALIGLKIAQIGCFIIGKLTPLWEVAAAVLQLLKWKYNLATIAGNEFTLMMKMNISGCTLLAGAFAAVAIGGTIGMELYNKWLPFRRLINDLIWDIDKLKDKLGIKNAGVDINKSVFKNMQYDSITAKWIPAIGHEKEFTLNKQGFYVPKKVNIPILTPKQPIPDDKSTIDIHVTTDKGSTATVHHKSARGHLKLKGAQAR